MTEMLLVHDHGPDGSAAVIRALAGELAQIRPVWLSRNFGQHAATLAGMASSGGDWVVTLDEDGQHDPARHRPDARRRHAASRRRCLCATDRTSLRTARCATSRRGGRSGPSTGCSAATSSAAYNSYRLMLGEVARGVGAYAGAGVYLDVALGWIAGDVATCPVELREEGRRESGYTIRTLASHFWRMVLTSGTRLLRLVSVLGVAVRAARGAVRDRARDRPADRVGPGRRLDVRHGRRAGRHRRRSCSRSASWPSTSGSRSTWRWASRST